MKRKIQISVAAAAVAVSAAALPVLAASLTDCVRLSKYLLGEEQQIELSGNDCNGDSVLDAVDLTLMKREVIGAEPAASDDYYVSQITFGPDSVTLKNAADQIVEADKALNVTVSGTKVTVIRPTANGTASFGDINLDGECAEGQIVVDVDETEYAEGQVTLNLRGLKLSNSSDSPVYISQIADECVLAVKNGTENVISDGTDYQNADQGAGAIYSLEDLKFKGKGKLTVNGNCGDGIVSKDDLKIWNGEIAVKAVDDGIRGKDSVRIGDPDAESYESLVLDITSKTGDGIKATNDTADSGKGYIRVNGGMIKINAENGDGIQASQAVEINGGDISIYTYQGSGYNGSGAQSQWGGRGGMTDGNPNKTEISAKGVKCCGLFDESGSTYLSGGDITVTGGSITTDTSDDSIHAAGNVYLNGGLLQLFSADDAVHADHNVTVGTKDAGTYDDVQIYIPKCYEGIEGVYIYQNSGTVYVISGDDGYNAAGGADNSGSQSGQQGPGGGFHPGFMSSSFGELNLSGGFVVVNSANGDHDAFDSNGNINITGGYYVCNGQEPLDCGDGGSYGINQTGGTYLAMTAGNTSLKTTYTFKDASGKALLTFQSAAGSPGISSKDNSTCYSGTTASGGTKLLADCPYGVTLGGSAAGGTQITAAPSSSSFPGGRF